MDGVKPEPSGSLENATCMNTCICTFMVGFCSLLVTWIAGSVSTQGLKEREYSEKQAWKCKKSSRKMLWNLPSRDVLYLFKKDQRQSLGTWPQATQCKWGSVSLGFWHKGFLSVQSMLSAKAVLDAVQALAAEEMLGHSLKIEGDEVRYGLKRVESEASKLSQSFWLW